MAFFELFRWICLGLFVTVAIVWLLDVAGALTIRDKSQRQILNFALGTTLVGGMASFAATEMFGRDAADEGAVRDPVSQPNAATSAIPVDSPTSSPSLSSPSPRPTLPEVPGEDDDEETPATELPQEIAAFLSSRNLHRPAIGSDWEAKYPSCALEARTTLLDKPAARDCFRALDGFNIAVLKPYQDAYDEYVPRVAQLSYEQPAGAVLDFLRQEATEFTKGTNGPAALYRTISADLDADYARLRRQAYS